MNVFEEIQLRASNRALMMARDENSKLITSLRDRVFDLEARTAKLEAQRQQALRRCADLWIDLGGES